MTSSSGGAHGMPLTLPASVVLPALHASVLAGDTSSAKSMLKRRAGGRSGSHVDTSGSSRTSNTRSHVEGESVCSERCSMGRTALHYAVLTGRAALVPLLISSGCDIHAVDNDGRTLLHLAALYRAIRNEAEAEAHQRQMVLNDNMDGDQLVPPSPRDTELETEAQRRQRAERDEKARASACHAAMKVLGGDTHDDGGVHPAVRNFVSQGDAGGSTAVHLAARNDQPMLLSLLLKKGGSDLVMQCDADGHSPLHHAAYRNAAPCVKVLLRTIGKMESSETRTQALNMRDGDGCTALHLAAHHGLYRIGRRLLAFDEAPCYVNIADQKGSTALHTAAFKGYTATVRFLCEEAHADARARDANGATPLHNAAYGGHKQCARFLLEAGADINATDDAGVTPLSAAAFAGRRSMLSFLLQQGADTSLPTVEDRAAPLHFAAGNGHASCVAALLAAGADPTQRTAAKEHGGDAVVVSSSAKRGRSASLRNVAAVADMRGAGGRVAAHLAAASNHRRVLHEITKHRQVLKQRLRADGKDSRELRECDGLSSVDSLGNTPLHVACLHNRAHCAAFLVEKGGVDPSVRNCDNQSALQLAASLGHRACTDAVVAAISRRKQRRAARAAEAAAAAEESDGAPSALPRTTVRHTNFAQRSHSLRPAKTPSDQLLGDDDDDGEDGDGNGGGGGGEAQRLRRRLEEKDNGGPLSRARQLHSTNSEVVVGRGADNGPVLRALSGDQLVDRAASRRDNARRLSSHVSSRRASGTDSRRLSMGGSTRWSDDNAVDSSGAEDRLANNNSVAGGAGGGGGAQAGGGSGGGEGDSGVGERRGTADDEKRLQRRVLSCMEAVVEACGSVDAVRNADRVEELITLWLHPSQSCLHAVLKCTQLGDADKTGKSLVQLFARAGTVVRMLTRAIDNEIDQTDSVNTVFRGNSIASKMLTQFALLVGRSFLQDAIGPGLDLIAHEENPVEVDPARIGDDCTEEALEERRAALLALVQALIDNIFASVEAAPPALRLLCRHLGHSLQRKFGADVDPSFAIGGLVFLRFLTPAIVTPDGAARLLEGGQVSREMRRTLTLVSKILTNIANGVEFGAKEQYMVFANAFIRENDSNMRTFLLDLRDVDGDDEGGDDEARQVPPVAAGDVLAAVNQLHARMLADRAKYEEYVAAHHGPLELLPILDRLTETPLLEAAAAQKSAAGAQRPGGGQKSERKPGGFATLMRKLFK